MSDPNSNSNPSPNPNPNPSNATDGRELLERKAPPDYLEKWTSVLAGNQVSDAEVASGEVLVRAAETASVIIFRLEEEWLAFPANLLQEVTPPCAIHTLPHRSDALLLGLVSIRGEILLCISLSHMLNLAQGQPRLPGETTTIAHPDLGTAARMVVIMEEDNRWVFPVDEVAGIHRFHMDEFQETPVVIAKAAEAYTKGVIRWQGKQVNFLDAHLLFYTLNRRIL